MVFAFSHRPKVACIGQEPFYQSWLVSIAVLLAEAHIARGDQLAAGKFLRGRLRSEHKFTGTMLRPKKAQLKSFDSLWPVTSEAAGEELLFPIEQASIGRDGKCQKQLGPKRIEYPGSANSNIQQIRGHCHVCSLGFLEMTLTFTNAIFQAQ